MTILEITNHVRQCSLAELRDRLTNLQERDPEKFEVVVNFLMGLEERDNAGA